jgi:hypothetical protein
MYLFFNKKFQKVVFTQYKDGSNKIFLIHKGDKTKVTSYCKDIPDSRVSLKNRFKKTFINKKILENVCSLGKNHTMCIIIDPKLR